MANAVAQKVLDSGIPEDAVVEIKEEHNMQPSAEEERTQEKILKTGGGDWGGH